GERRGERAQRGRDGVARGARAGRRLSTSPDGRGQRRRAFEAHDPPPSGRAAGDERAARSRPVGAGLLRRGPPAAEEARDREGPRRVALVRAVLVSHFHWDREWHRTFEAYRARLVDAVDDVLALVAADPGYRFVLDGQAILLEDYLAIRPERREALARAL